MEQLLIVEDDIGLNQGLCKALKADDRQIISCHDLKAAREQLLCGSVSLVLLDINLPDGSGFDLVAELHGVCATPVFMLTARNTEMDEVKALELGVADYMSKPFSLAVLKARIRRILQAQTPSATVTSGGITIDRKAAQVFRGEKKIDLSKIEYQLLCYLVENREQVLTKEQILAHVWDAQGKFVDENTLSVTIRRLRAKIERDPKHPALIRTVHGIGYIWKSEEGRG